MITVVYAAGDIGTIVSAACGGIAVYGDGGVGVARIVRVLVPVVSDYGAGLTSRAVTLGYGRYDNVAYGAVGDKSSASSRNGSGVYLRAAYVEQRSVVAAVIGVVERGIGYGAAAYD